MKCGGGGDGEVGRQVRGKGMTGGDRVKVWG